MWVKFNEQTPEEHGYYYIHYLHKDGKEYAKAIWWDGTEFKYNDYVKEVIEYIPECFEYYVPCMLNAGKT